MAEQILSQVEVDALLKGLSNGEIKTETERQEEAGGAVKAYDFANQERTVRGKMPTLDMINEKFSRSIRSSVFNILRKSIDVSPEGVKTMKYEDFLRNLQMPSSLNIFNMTPLRGQGLLAIDPNLVFIVVDSYFGGDGRFHTRVEGRDFTNVEQAVIKRVVDNIFTEMKEIWKPVHPLEFKFVRAEMNPQFVNIINHSEPCIVSTFKMEVEAQSNKFYFCMPFSALEPIKEKLYGMQRVDVSDGDKKWGASLIEQFGNVPLTVSSEIGRANINVEELLNLKKGDIIQLDKKSREPLDVTVEGIRKFFARPGVMDNNYALKILSAVNEGGKNA